MKAFGARGGSALRRACSFPKCTAEHFPNQFREPTPSEWKNYYGESIAYED